jgi:hypothetical protein
MRGAVILGAAAAVVPGALAQALCQPAKASDLVRVPKDKVDLTLSLSTNANCGDAWRVLSVDRNLALRGDFKDVPRTVHPRKLDAATNRASEDPDFGALALSHRDVYPEYGDLPGNWLVQKGVQTVTMEIGEVDKASNLKVYETLNPGGVRKIELLDAAKKATTIFENKDLDDGSLRCGDQVLVRSGKRHTLLETMRHEVRVGSEQESEDPSRFVLHCAQRKANDKVRYGDIVQVQSLIAASAAAGPAGASPYWNDARDPNVPMVLVSDAAAPGTRFTIVDPKTEDSDKPVLRNTAFALRSPWGRFLHVSDFTKGTLAFSSRFADEWSRFSARTQGSQVISVDFKAPASPWVAKYVRLTVDATKHWRGIDAVEVTGQERIYPNLPGPLFSNKLYVKSRASTKIGCGSIVYRGTSGAPATLRICWGCPSVNGGKPCSGNGKCLGGPAELGDSCTCTTGWGGDACEKNLCPNGPPLQRQRRLRRGRQVQVQQRLGRQGLRGPQG